MTRFGLLLVAGLGLVILLTIALRWLWRQRWSSAIFGRRVCILTAGARPPLASSPDPAARSRGIVRESF